MSKGLYAAYFTGTAGQSVGLFYIGEGIFAGIDIGAMKYDGTYVENADGSLETTVEYVVPAGAPLISRATVGVADERLAVKVRLPSGFDDGRVIMIETPAGPINVRFEKLKELP